MKSFVPLSIVACLSLGVGLAEDALARWHFDGPPPPVLHGQDRPSCLVIDGLTYCPIVPQEHQAHPLFRSDLVARVGPTISPISRCTINPRACGRDKAMVLEDTGNVPLNAWADHLHLSGGHWGPRGFTHPLAWHQKRIHQAFLGSANSKNTRLTASGNNPFVEWARLKDEWPPGKPRTIYDPGSEVSYPVNGPVTDYGGITGFNEWMTPIGALLSPQTPNRRMLQMFIEDLENVGTAATLHDILRSFRLVELYRVPHQWRKW